MWAGLEIVFVFDSEWKKKFLTLLRLASNVIDRNCRMFVYSSTKIAIFNSKLRERHSSRASRISSFSWAFCTPQVVVYTSKTILYISFSFSCLCSWEISWPITAKKKNFFALLQAQFLQWCSHKNLFSTITWLTHRWSHFLVTSESCMYVKRIRKFSGKFCDITATEKNLPSNGDRQYQVKMIFCGIQKETNSVNFSHFTLFASKMYLRKILTENSKM